MMNILNPRVHGILDYALAAAFLVVPSLLSFVYPATPLAYITGAAYLGTSLLTKYPLGALKLIPFPIHGVIEALMAAAWIAMPWLFGFAADPAARNFFVVAGIGLLGVVVLTDYKSSGTHRFEGAERRHAMIDRRQRSMPVRADRRIGPADRRSYAAA